MCYTHSFPSCCDLRIVHDVSDITKTEIKRENRDVDRYGTKRIAVVQVLGQAKEHKLFLANGWKNFGRKWVARSGNTLQMIMYVPKKRSKR